MEGDAVASLLSVGERLLFPFKKRSLNWDGGMHAPSGND